MPDRKHIPAVNETEVLTKSLRRCCLCYYLRNDEQPKDGQIAHLDQDPSNFAVENLAFLCFEHHDKYDSKTRQSKNFTIHEVKTHRNNLYERIILQDAERARTGPKPESVDQIVSRYEEVLAIREENIERLKIERDEKRRQLEDMTVAIQRTESELVLAKQQLATARSRGNGDQIVLKMAEEGSIRRILLLEPHMETGVAMCGILGRMGYETTHVITAAEAFKQVEASACDLLLAEVHDWTDSQPFIPKNSGYDLMTAAKRQGIFGIAVSVLDETEEMVKSYEAGYSFHISKPIVMGELLEAISLLAKRKARGMKP